MEAEGPDPALAFCGQKSTFTFLPGEASREAGPQPRVAPGRSPSHFLPGPNCRQLLQGRGPEEGWKVEVSLRWESEMGRGGRDPQSLGREGPGFGFLSPPIRACFLRSEGKVARCKHQDPASRLGLALGARWV